MIPMTPKEMSITVHQNGICRTGPAISASGMIATQQSMPHSMTQMLRTGSRHGPQKAIAITRWAKASQSVPYAMKGWFAAVSTNPSRTRSIQATSPSGAGTDCSTSASSRTSLTSGNAVTPLSTSPATKMSSQARIAFMIENLEHVFPARPPAHNTFTKRAND
ncbi:hypothetical protein ACIBSW_35805 [Actinoplanes sp. NPDC049668]|uniref:hypothetical protein n=1 Tax=Actinoplanes sp. NPDC049668 TaxID=3363904 RepID=UPI0037894E01